GQPPRAAAHVEDRAAAVPEQFLVGGVGRPAPPGHVQGQRAAVGGPQGQRLGLLALLVLFQGLLVQGDRSCPHAVAPMASLPMTSFPSPAGRRTVASSLACAAKRLRGASRATATASAAVSTSRSVGRSVTRSPAATSRARWTAPVLAVDMGTPRSRAGSGTRRPSAQNPPSAAGPKK